MAGLFSGITSTIFGDTKVDDTAIQAQAVALQREEQLKRQREQQDYQRQVELARYLQSVISGTAPSVAGGQLVAGQDQIARQMQAQAAGATGMNGGLARYGTILGTGDLSAATNQQAAQLRAQEVAQAANATGALTSAMGGRSAGMAATAGGEGLNYAHLGYNIDEANRLQKNKEDAAVLSGGGSALSQYLSSVK